MGGAFVFKLSPKKQRDLTEILREVINYAELEAIAVITKEGLHLAFFAAGKVDSDLLSAIADESLFVASIYCCRTPEKNIRRKAERNYRRMETGYSNGRMVALRRISGEN